MTRRISRLGCPLGWARRSEMVRERSVLEPINCSILLYIVSYCNYHIISYHVILLYYAIVYHEREWAERPLSVRSLGQGANLKTRRWKLWLSRKLESTNPRSTNLSLEIDRYHGSCSPSFRGRCFRWAPPPLWGGGRSCCTVRCTLGLPLLWGGVSLPLYSQMHVGRCTLGPRMPQLRVASCRPSDSVSRYAFCSSTDVDVLKTDVLKRVVAVAVVVVVVVVVAYMDCRTL